jgi:glycosyltransferase involved in cell wall biosynthesis
VVADDDLPPGTVIGYHGWVQPWFDFDLLHAVAADRPDWQFAIVGPVNPAVAEAAARVERLGNVTFLGERPPRSMSAYAQAFDVGVVWRVVDDMTAGMTPLKLNEYLAAGTPVVSTPLPASKAQPAVITASDTGGMIDAVEEALRRRTDSAWQARTASAAAEADWARRIDPLMRRLETKGGRRVP